MLYSTAWHRRVFFLVQPSIIGFADTSCSTFPAALEWVRSGVACVASEGSLGEKFCSSLLIGVSFAGTSGLRVDRVCWGALAGPGVLC